MSNSISRKYNRKHCFSERKVLLKGMVRDEMERKTKEKLFLHIKQKLLFKRVIIHCK